MRVTKLQIHNIGLIADETIELNKPLIIFYGEIRQGKSTILNAVRWCFGGAFPDEIIRKGEKEAFVELTFDGGLIRREWYVGKDGKTKAREVDFIQNGKAVRSPVAEIRRLLNPFLLDQFYFEKMSEVERRKYFTELFAVDTAALDTELFRNETEARTLRARISGYGDIDLKVVEKVDTAKLRNELEIIRAAHDEAVARVEAQNRVAQKRESDIMVAQCAIERSDREIERLKREMDEAEARRAIHVEFLKKNPVIAAEPKPVMPDVSVLEARISDAAANNVRAEQYLANKQRAEKKAEEEAQLSAMEARARQIKVEKANKLKEASATTGIPELEFTEGGDFKYQGASAGMLSTAQIMQLSEALSAKYPAGFGLDLIDRGESLGKSIYSLIARAQTDQRTILATVVGDKPATSPPNVGVFVVEQGEIK